MLLTIVARNCGFCCLHGQKHVIQCTHKENKRFSKVLRKGNEMKQAWFKLAGGRSNWINFGMCELPKNAKPVKETKSFVYYEVEEGIMKYRK